MPFAREVDGALVFDGDISREEDADAAGPRATEQTFDAANPTHLAGAQRIVEATRHLNDVFPS